MRVLPALLFLLASCTPVPQAEPPISDSLFVEVLIDLHLASARAAHLPDWPAETREALLARHGLDSATLDHAFRYYSEHPDAYLQRYTELLDRLSAERPSGR